MTGKLINPNFAFQARRRQALVRVPERSGQQKEDQEQLQQRQLGREAAVAADAAAGEESFPRPLLLQ